MASITILDILYILLEGQTDDCYNFKGLCSQLKMKLEEGPFDECVEARCGIVYGIKI